MSEKNYLNETVVPRMPKSVSNEQLFVFVPTGSDFVAGIFKINIDDFDRHSLPVLKIVESESLKSVIIDSSGEYIVNPKYNGAGYVRAKIIKAYVDAADEALQDKIELKQDINLSKTIAEATTVEGALINLDSSTKDLKTRMTRAEGDINTLKNADEGLANRINNLEQSAYVGETPIGTYTSGATLPTQEQLTAFVQQEVSRAPKLGDVVLFTQIVVDGTDKSYKFMYTETGWSNYVVSILEKLSNTPGTSETDGYTQKAVNGIVQNPNLLINPNFAINQRGQSEYTCNSKIYTVDRTYSNRSVITPLQGGGIKLNVLSGQSNPYIQQVVEHATALVGKRLAFSCCINDVIGEIVFSELVPSEDSTTNVFVNKDFSVGAITCNIQLLKYKPSTADDSVLQVTFTIANPNNTIISWWKLEVGEVCTPYIPLNAAEEFLKCTYYYKKLGRVGTQNQYGDAYAYNGTTLWLPIADALSTMRKDKNSTITCDHLENLRCVTNSGLGAGLIPTAVGFAAGAIVLTVSGATQYARYRVLDGASTENGIFGIDIEI